jgi:hypothetical protein
MKAFALILDRNPTALSFPQSLEADSEVVPRDPHVLFKYSQLNIKLSQ